MVLNKNPKEKSMSCFKRYKSRWDTIGKLKCRKFAQGVQVMKTLIILLLTLNLWCVFLTHGSLL